MTRLTQTKSLKRGLPGSVASAIIVLAALVIVLAGLKSAQGLVVPFLFACFIAIILLGPLQWLERKGLKPWMALTLLCAAVILVVFLMSALIGNSIDEFRTSLPDYQARISTDLGAMHSWLEKIGLVSSEGSLSDALSPARTMQFIGDILGNLTGLLANGFLILLTVAFILAEIKLFPVKLKQSVSDPEAILTKIQAFTTSANNYMMIKAAISALTGFIIAVFLAILGVDFPVLWGVLAFLLNFVPNIGSIIAAVPAIIIAYLQLGPGIAAIVAAGYVATNVFVGNVIEPRFMGKSVGLSTLVVFLSLVFWGFILGPIGMLLSVPLTMMVKIALSENDETAWISSLLGNSAEPMPAPNAG